MGKEFNLSEKLETGVYGFTWLHKDDVKEFIRLIEERIDDPGGSNKRIIDKLAGEKLNGI